MPDIKNNLGQLFMIGFPGKEPSDTFLNFINEEKIGGVILFKENCSTHQVTQDNIKLIKDACGDSKVMVAVDQEGGRVSRIIGAPAEIASAWEYGTKLGLAKFAEDYTRCIVCLESLGIDINLAPVGDIFLKKNNQCLKDRCFGEDYDQVSRFVVKAIEISQKNGIISCVKHFPGLGDSDIDPHEETAKANYDMVLWEQREKKVFTEAINAGTDMIMSTHIHLPQLDNIIATGSEKIIKRLLRDTLGYDGLIITDDLLMKGASPLGIIGERAVASFKAGHDILLFGQDFDSAMIAYDYFCDAYSRGEITREQVTLSLNRIAGLKFKLGKSVML